MPSSRLLISPYFLIHNAVLAAFFLQVYPRYLRRNALETAMGRERLLAVGYSSLSHEEEVIGMIFLAFCAKLRNRNFGEILHRFLVTLQIASWILTWLTGDRLALLGLSLLYVAMFVLLVPPKYKGESKVIVLDSDSFQNLVCGDDDDDTFHLVCCHTPSSADFRYFEPVFCQLSVADGGNHVQFYSVDLSQNAELATELEIDITTQSKQLPTLLMFHRGVEVRRLPPFADDGKVVKTTMDKKGVTQYFELDHKPAEVSYRRDSRSMESKRKTR